MPNHPNPAVRLLTRLCLLLCLMLCPALGHALDSMPKKPWTVMVYMCADNNLEPNGLADLSRIEQSLPDDAHVIVVMDRSKGGVKNYGDWTGTRLYYARRSPPFPNTSAVNLPPQLSSQLLMDLGELDLSNPREITNFIGVAARACPADRYIFIPWNHGGGWQANLSDEDGGNGQPGKSAMTIYEFADAVRAGARSLPRGKFDAILFNMCLMGHMEVLHAMQGLTDYVFASAPPIPGESLQYDKILPRLTAGVSTRDFVAALPQDHAEFYDHGSMQEGAFSAYDMSRLPAAMTALRAVIGDLAGLARDQYVGISRATFYAASMWDLNEDLNNGPKGYWEVSLTDWLQRLEHELPMLSRDHTSALRAALGELIIGTSASSNIQHGRGVGIYLPPRRSCLNPGIQGTPYDQESGLTGFLGRLYDAQDQNSRMPVVGNLVAGNYSLKPGHAANGPNDFDIDQGTPIQTFDRGALRFDVTGPDILRTELMCIQVLEGKGFVLSKSLITDLASAEDPGAGNFASISPEYKSGTTTLMRSINGLTFMISNGQVAVPITAIQSSTSNQLLSNVTMVNALYSHPSLGGQEIPVIIKFSNVFRIPISVTAVVPDPTGRTTAVPLALAPGGHIRAGMLMVGQNGEQKVEFGQPLDLSAGILLMSMGQVPDGTVMRFGIAAESMGGQQAVSFTNPVTVRRNPSQEAMLNNAAQNFSSNLMGRYAMVQYMRNDDGTEDRSPTLANLELTIDGQTPVWSITDQDGKVTGKGGFSFLAGGTMPTLILFSEPKMKGMPSTKSVITWYAFLQGGGEQRIWYLIEAGIGQRWALFPVSFFANAVEGTWEGKSGRWEFSQGQVRLTTPDGKTHLGKYTLRDQILTAEGLPMGRQFAVMPNRQANQLALTYRESSPGNRGRMLELRRVSGEAGTQQQQVPPAPVPQTPGPAAGGCPLCGNWVSDAATGRARLSITPQPGAGYLILHLKARNRVIYCAVNVGQGVLYATDARGAHQDIGFTLKGGTLTLSFKGLSPISFTKTD
ncbi:MAG: hypothetical protein K6A65_08620 [Succinivibrionaceae bacterium]|nr:hypothetical protein [Succinivibrionaceae bacterium]